MWPGHKKHWREHNVAAHHLKNKNKNKEKKEEKKEKHKKHWREHNVAAHFSKATTFPLQTLPACSQNFASATDNLQKI